MRVAYSYAKALYLAARDSGVSQASSLYDQIESVFGQLNSLMKKSEPLKIALLSPLSTSEEKLILIEELSKKAEMLPLMRQFLMLLARKGRLGLLPRLAEQFKTVRLQEEGG